MAKLILVCQGDCARGARSLIFFCFVLVRIPEEAIAYHGMEVSRYTRVGRRIQHITAYKGGYKTFSNLERLHALEYWTAQIECGVKTIGFRYLAMRGTQGAGIGCGGGGGVGGTAPM